MYWLIIAKFLPFSNVSFCPSLYRLSGVTGQGIFMHQNLSSSTCPHDSDETEEPVLVEVQEFSEDDENFAREVEEDDHLDCDYDDEEEKVDKEEEFEDDDDDDEMSLVRVGLHDINTLRHLYRFGLLATHNSMNIRGHILISSSHFREIPSFEWSE